MNSENPYAAPLIPPEPPKVPSRLLAYLDIAGILCAAMPLVHFAVFFTTYLLLSGEDPTAKIAVVLALAFVAASILWLIGGVYNCVRVFQGRKLAILGIVLNIASLVVWAGIFRLAFML
ncbi:MAG: hypothetical protein ACKVP0_15795 [Pirellulaceae bacterium]